MPLPGIVDRWQISDKPQSVIGALPRRGPELPKTPSSGQAPEGRLTRRAGPSWTEEPRYLGAWVRSEGCQERVFVRDVVGEGALPGDLAHTHSRGTAAAACRRS